jgi:hypothetical protein
MALKQDGFSYLFSKIKTINQLPVIGKMPVKQSGAGLSRYLSRNASLFFYLKFFFTSLGYFKSSSNEFPLYSFKTRRTFEL